MLKLLPPRRFVARSTPRFYYQSARVQQTPQLMSRNLRFRYSTTAIPDAGAHDVPRRSFFRRFLTFTAIAIVSSGAGFAMTTGPVLTTVNEMLYPPSDAETRTMFIPSNNKIAREESFIQNHPLVQELRSNPAFSESRPHMKIPASVKEHHLTAGALSGLGRLEVPPMQFTEKGGKSAITIFYVGTDLCGYRDLVHGGVMATMLDEALARCAFQALPNKVGMTANLNINFRRPLPAGTFAVIKCHTTGAEGRKAWVEGTLENLPAENEATIVYCDSNALFIEPKNGQAMALLYPAAA